MRILHPVLGLLSLILGAASLCSAADITYDVNQVIGAGSVTGDIVTDGTIGGLDFDFNIVDYNLLVNDGTSTFDLLGPLSGGNSDYIDHAGNGDLSATATQLSFDFSDSGTNFFYFTTPTAPQSLVCFSNDAGCTSGGESGELLQVNGGGVQMTAVSGTQVIGTTSSTPEPSTLALLGAGAALLGFWKPRNKKQQSR